MLSNEESINWEKYIPIEITLSSAQFFSEQERIEKLRWYFDEADNLFSKHLSEAEDHLIETLLAKNHPVSSFLASQVKSNSKKLFDINSYQLTIGQMSFSRNVDNFLTYLKSILSEVINAKPELLKSSEKENLEFILSFSNMDELRNALKEKKIEELFYKNFKDISDFISDRLKILICPDSKLFDEIDLIIQKRNIVVHNRGRISREFLRKNKNTNLQENEILYFSQQDVSSLNMIFQKVIVRIDKIND